MGDSLQSFEQLDIWQTSQLRRAASSISANIAEGFGRHSQKDKLHFYTIAYGSLLEVKNFIYLAKKLDFIADDQDMVTLDHVQMRQKSLNALMKSVRSRA
jgi:four helix bundle protein